MPKSARPGLSPVVHAHDKVGYVPYVNSQKADDLGPCIPSLSTGRLAGAYQEQ